MQTHRSDHFLNIDACRAATLRYLDLLTAITIEGIVLNSSQYLSVYQTIECMALEYRKNEGGNSSSEEAFKLNRALSVFFDVWHLSDMHQQQGSQILTDRHQQSIAAVTKQMVMFSDLDEEVSQLYRAISHDVRKPEKNSPDFLPPLITVEAMGGKVGIVSKKLPILTGPNDLLPTQLRDFLTSFTPLYKELKSEIDVESRLYEKIAKQPQVKTFLNEMNLRPSKLNKLANSMMHKVFHEEVDVSVLFNNSDQLSDDAKRWGFEIVETLPKPTWADITTQIDTDVSVNTDVISEVDTDGFVNIGMTSQTDSFVNIDVKSQEKAVNTPFTVINFGSGKSFVTEEVLENKYALLSLLGQEFEATKRNKETYIINDGPGSTGDPESIQSMVNPKTGSLMTIKWPADTPFSRTFSRIKGMLTGDGLTQSTDRVLKKLQWLEYHGQLPEKMALIGFSRGGAENHYLANAIKREFQNRISLDLFDIEPVPGGTDILNVEAYKLPDNVNSAQIYLAENEKRPFYQVMDDRWLKRESSETQVSFFGLPDKHYRLSTQYRRAGLWVGDALADFLTTHKVIDTDSALYRQFHLSRLEKDDLETGFEQSRKLTNNYIEASSASEKVEKLSTLWDFMTNLKTRIENYEPVSTTTIRDKVFKDNSVSSPLDLPENRQKKNVTPQAIPSNSKPLIRFRGASLGFDRTRALLVQQSAFSHTEEDVCRQAFSLTVVDPIACIVINPA